MPQEIPLYRFLDAAAAIKTVEERHFKVSQFLELNDPFEGVGAFALHDVSVKDLAIIKPALHAWSQKWNEELGLISFSKSPHDPVLWGHYADKHRGVAIEVIDLNGENLITVDYDKPRIKLEIDKLQIGHPDREEYWGKIMPEMLEMKAKSWEYEQESRYIIPLEECERVKDGMYFKKVPDNYIARIILGINCPYSTDYFKKSLDLNGFKDVEVVRAEKDEWDFKINF